jgi:hypothetical protein
MHLPRISRRRANHVLAAAVATAASSHFLAALRGIGRAIASAWQDQSITDPFLLEALEQRMLFTAFTASMSAPQTGSYGSAYTVDLYNSGGQASQWDVKWRDGTADTIVNASSYLGGVFPVPLPVSHTYSSSSPPTGPIYATATLASNTSIHAIARYALNVGYGTGSRFTHSGQTLYNPYANYGSVNVDAMVVDHVGGDTFNGDSYITHPFYQQNGTAQFAVTLIDASGAPVNAWGNDGTYVVSSFGGGSDVPYAIAISPDGAELAIAGKCSTGWAIAVVSTALNGSVYGSTVWHTASSFVSGTGSQANAVEIEQTEVNSPVHLVAVGTDGTHMVAAALNMADGSAFWSGTGVVTIALPAHPGSATATAVVENDELDVHIANAEQLIVGGTTYYCCTGVEFGSNFTLVALADSDGSLNPYSNFGTGGVIQTNFGNTACAGSWSNDSLYGLAEWIPSGGAELVTAVGSSNAQCGTTDFALARYAATTGALDTSFGPSSNGLAFGPAGVARAVVIQGAAFGSGTLDVSGSFNDDVVVAQFLPTASGTLVAGDADPNFGYGGVYQTDFGATTNNSTDAGYSVDLQYDSLGNIAGILVCGTSLQSGSSNAEIALADYLPSNAIVLS